MKMRKLSSLLAGMALLAGVVGSAQALTLTAGNYKITLDNYDAGTLYNPFTPGTQCNTVESCNAAAVSQAPGAGATGIDTQGILSVALITNLATGQVEYIKGTASTIGGVTVGPFLTGVFTGLQDKYVENNCGITGCATTALAVGGGFKIWSNTGDYDPTLGPLGSDLPNYSYAPSVSNGALFLEGLFAAGAALAGDDTASYVTSYNSGTVAGQGSGYLDFTGGAAYEWFNTNSVENNNGGYNDAFLTTTFDNVNGVASSLGWTVKGVVQISGELVPEPGSLALASLALLGLGFARRRKG